MNKHVSIISNDNWLDQIFSAKSVGRHGVVRRKIADVERKIGRERLEVEVRRRGYHMLVCGNQFVIVCDKNEIIIIC